MATSRITPSLMADRSLNDINKQLARISKLQEQLSSGLRVNRPSDDPIDARRAINVRTLLQRNEQFIGNIDDVQPQVDETASALQGIVDVIQRAIELTTQGANGTNSQAQLDALALEIDALLETVFTTSNAQTNGRSIFAGTATLNPAFSATRVAGEITAVTYDGNTDLFSVGISEGASISVNMPGSTAFQGSIDVFAVLIGIRDSMRAGNQADLSNVRLDQLQESLDQTLFGLARAGAVQNRLDRVSNNLQDTNLSLEALLSDKINADYAETVINLNVAQNSYQAALSAAGRILQTSLLDYIG